MEENIEDIINCFQKTHFPCGSLFKDLCKIKSLCSKDNELEKIYYLVESLTPSLRYKSIHRYDKSAKNDCNEQLLPLNKKYVDFMCDTNKVEDNIKEFLDKIKSLPKEWSLVQISSEINTDQKMDNKVNPLNLIVINCGEKEVKPFCIPIGVPMDSVKNEPIEICQEINKVVQEIKEYCSNFFKTNGRVKSSNTHKSYYEARKDLDNQLMEVLKVVQDRWLGVWRCLLIGKYVDAKKEYKITEIVETLCKEFNINVSGNTKDVLRHIVKGTCFISNAELKTAVQFIFPNKEKQFYFKITKRIKEMSEKFCVEAYKSQRRHPVILILEENLDVFPWEMLDVLEDHPVSRMPSFHFTYGLFKEHEKTIENGFKTNINVDNGSFLINPGQDLEKMEKRLKVFFDYWTPQWTTSVCGRQPSVTEIEDMLKTSDIFIYSGHGSGSQYLSGDTIQRLRINGVVFLFGCSSVKLQFLGPQVEMSSSFHPYLIACSPCVIGALWEVTDTDTDILCTNLLSSWIPSKAAHHWTQIDKKLWVRGGGVVQNQQKNSKNYIKHEPELLRALNKSRKTVTYFSTKASFVARGIPIKISH